MKNFTERFQYDSQNRLTGITLKRSSGQDLHCGVSYDALGRLTSKQAVTAVNGTPQVSCVFSQPAFDATKIHAINSAQSISDLFPATAQTVTYTGFDKAEKIKQGNDSICYTYGYDHQRIRMEEHVGSTFRTKDYVGMCEYVTETGTSSTRSFTYLNGPYGVFAVIEKQNGVQTPHYVLKDNLGSWNTITDGDGTVEQRLSYDAWGRRRNTTDFGYDNVSHTFDRGYTLHEHYDGFDLINMNGRLYDPILGRMLSPDIVVQDEQSSQAYNRYSYCFNNPLRFTDPSGFFVENPPYQFMLLNPNKIILKYYYGVEPSTVEYNTNESEGTKRINVKWTYDGDDYEANWVHQNLEGYYQTDKYGCLATCMMAQERRFPYGNMDITEESMLSLSPEDNGIKAYDGWISFEELTNVYHKWDNGKTALTDPFVSEFENKYGSVEQYTFDAMNKGEGITYHYYTDDPKMNHAINAYEAVRYFDGNKGKTTYDIRMWDPDPNIGGSKPFTRYRLNKIHTLKLKLH